MTDDTTAIILSVVRIAFIAASISSLSLFVKSHLTANYQLNTCAFCYSVTLNRETCDLMKLA